MVTAAPTTDALSEVYKAASEPIRVRILALLAHGELCVCHLHAMLEAPQPTVSRHLAVLRKADLVRARRDGPWVHYVLTDAAERWFAPALGIWRQDAAQRDRCGAAKRCG